MGYIATNETDRTIAIRDDSGKVLMEPGDRRVVRGDRHAGAIGASGLSLVFVQSHREIEALAAAEDAARVETEVQPKPKRGRRAAVTVREEA